jgi:hypothetical protein
VIACLLLAIQGAWGVYQKKRESLARLQQEQDAKPRIILVKAESNKETADTFDPTFAQLEH